MKSDLLATFVIFDLDDAAPDQESNAMNWLIDFKSQFPHFKVTLFTILGRWKLPILKKLSTFHWIQFAAHGYTHFQNSESFDWTEEEWHDALNRYEREEVFQRIFKAPNWEMSKLGYQVLKDRGWSVACRKSQIKDVPNGMKYYCFETNYYAKHGHTWTMKAHVDEGMCQWGEKTRFGFVSEHLETK